MREHAGKVAGLSSRFFSPSGSTLIRSGDCVGSVESSWPCSRYRCFNTNDPLWTQEDYMCGTNSCPCGTPNSVSRGSRGTAHTNTSSRISAGAFQQYPIVWLVNISWSGSRNNKALFYLLRGHRLRALLGLHVTRPTDTQTAYTSPLSHTSLLVKANLSVDLCKMARFSQQGCSDLLFQPGLLD